MSTKQVSSSLSFLLILILILISYPGPAHGRTQEEASACEAATSEGCYDKAKSQTLKIIGIFTILVASMIGVGLPLFSNSIPALKPESDTFVIIKALASGVILSTGFMHVLPDSWNNFNSTCLPAKPWKEFAFPTFIAMVSAVLTMMMDTVATAYFKKRGGGAMHAHSHGTAVHSHRTPVQGDEIEMELGQTQGDLVVEKLDEKAIELLRYRIVAQV